MNMIDGLGWQNSRRQIELMRKPHMSCLLVRIGISLPVLTKFGEEESKGQTERSLFRRRRVG
jgi:hypothetical protein